MHRKRLKGPEGPSKISPGRAEPAAVSVAPKKDATSSAAGRIANLGHYAHPPARKGRKK